LIISDGTTNRIRLVLDELDALSSLYHPFRSSTDHRILSAVDKIIERAEAVIAQLRVVKVALVQQLLMRSRDYVGCLTECANRLSRNYPAARVFNNPSPTPLTSRVESQIHRRFRFCHMIAAASWNEASSKTPQ
jgi:hypothetical protein